MKTNSTAELLPWRSINLTNQPGLSSLINVMRSPNFLSLFYKYHVLVIRRYYFTSGLIQYSSVKAGRGEVQSQGQCFRLRLAPQSTVDTTALVQVSV